MADVDDRDLAVGDNPDTSSPSLHGQDEAVDPMIERFQARIDAEITEHLATDSVAQRLDRLWRRQQRAADAAQTRAWTDEDPAWPDRAEALAEYGERVVEVWLKLVLALTPDGGERARDEVRGLASETVAWALLSFRNVMRSQPPPRDPPSRTEFLIECAGQLPRAYGSRQLSGSARPFDRIEQGRPGSSGADLLERLDLCVGRDADVASRLLQAWGIADEEIADFIERTQQALAVVRHRPAGPVEATP